MNKEEISKELLCKIYGAYGPCKVMANIGVGSFVLLAVDYQTKSILLRDDNGDGPYTVSHGWLYIGQYQDKIILSSLSEITDEEAYVLADIWGVASEDKLMKFLGVGRIQTVKKILLEGNHFLQLNNVIHGFDYLRRKGYMLPVEGIDLFEAGIAIDKITLKK